MRRKSANDKVVRVVKLYETKLEEFEKSVNTIDEFAEIFETDDDDAVSAIYNSLYDKDSELPTKFIKEFAEREFDTTELVCDLAKELDLYELFSILESNEELVSEGEIYHIQQNMSERVKNILRKIVQ